MIDSSKIILTPTKVFYLKMDEQPSERLTVQPDISFKTLTKPIDTDEYLKYYGTVGFQFNWLDRLVMPSAELKAKKDYAGLSKLPKDASPVRVVNRCEMSGRRRGYLRKFNASRMTFREAALNGLIPGVTKASW